MVQYLVRVEFSRWQKEKKSVCNVRGKRDVLPVIITLVFFCGSQKKYS